MITSSKRHEPRTSLPNDNLAVAFPKGLFKLQRRRATIHLVLSPSPTQPLSLHLSLPPERARMGPMGSFRVTSRRDVNPPGVFRLGGRAVHFPRCRCCFCTPYLILESPMPRITGRHCEEGRKAGAAWRGILA